MIDSPVTIRPAIPGDAASIVDLIRLSMGDEVDWLFGQEQSHPTDTVMKALFLRKANRLSHDVCWVAELDGQVVGLLLAFPGRQLQRRELYTGMHLISIFGLRATVRLAKHQPLYGSLVESEKDEFYISNLAVSPTLQRRGFGYLLLSFAEELAHASGLLKCSLIVTYDNPARRLYEKSGYNCVHSYDIHHPVIAHGSGGFHRMVKSLAHSSANKTT